MRESVDPPQPELRTPAELAIRQRDPEAATRFVWELEPDADWYHTIELPGGRVTPGIYDHRALVPHYGLPDDLSGTRALDVGTADGFWAFEFERRLAEVVACDLASWAELDFPPEARERLSDRPLPPFGSRFEVARDLLGSRVHKVATSVYELTPERLGTFDLVHAGDILLHLERPLEALRRMRSVLAPAGVVLIADVVDPDLPASPDGHHLVHYHGGWNTVHWWTPSIDALAQMLVDAGFSDVSLRLVYKLALRDGTGPWRALLRATR